MRRSLRLLVLGVAVPGALSPVLYARFQNQREVERAHVYRVDMEAPRPPRPHRAERPHRPRRPERASAAPRAPLPPPPPSIRVVMGDAAPCRYAHEVRLTADDAAGLLLDVDAGSGDLRVEGVRGLERVEVEARECASDETFLDGLEATLERGGDRVVLRTRYPDDLHGGWGDNRYARIDLTVRIPMGMAAVIRDGSGDAFVAGTGRLEMDDSSGDLEVRGVEGPVRLRDSSGGLRVSDVGGDLEIADGSGEIEVRGVRGTVTVEDGSGSVEIADVDGDVRIPRDGSGSIRVDQVGGDLVVERDGSGGVRWDRVAGRVQVPRRGR